MARRGISLPADSMGMLFQHHVLSALALINIRRSVIDGMTLAIAHFHIHLAACLQAADSLQQTTTGEPTPVVELEVQESEPADSNHGAQRDRREYLCAHMRGARQAHKKFGRTDLLPNKFGRTHIQTLAHGRAHMGAGACASLQPYRSRSISGLGERGSSWASGHTALIGACVYVT